MNNHDPYSDSSRLSSFMYCLIDNIDPAFGNGCATIRTDKGRK
jgi:hypothetical protein